MLLFINACVRASSRTKRLADHLLKGLCEKETCTVKEIRLQEVDFPPIDEAFLQKRDSLLQSGALEDPVFALARDFAAADTIVIAAPFWDLSFPSILKQYLEQITVTGVTFFYTEDGVPQGLCRAKQLYYVTTSGGPLFAPEYGFGYVRSMAQGFYGIPEVTLVKAENLDIVGADVEKILREAKEQIDQMLNRGTCAEDQPL